MSFTVLLSLNYMKAMICKFYFGLLLFTNASQLMLLISIVSLLQVPDGSAGAQVPPAERC